MGKDHIKFQTHSMSPISITIYLPIYIKGIQAMPNICALFQFAIENA